MQPAGTPTQVTGYVYGISPARGSTIASNDILAETRYPDPATGVASTSERDTYTSNALAGCGQTACSIAGMRSRERCCRENRRFSCLDKVPEDFFHSQLGEGGAGTTIP